MNSVADGSASLSFCLRAGDTAIRLDRPVRIFPKYRYVAAWFGPSRLSAANAGAFNATVKAATDVREREPDLMEPV